MNRPMTGNEIAARFLERLDKTDPSGCWFGYRKPRADGYTPMLIDGRWTYAHRLAYELLVGPVTDGLELDHLCRDPRCVNPAHLEPVTRRENLVRGETIVARQVKATHCVNGHEFTLSNTYTRKSRRSCRACHRDTERARRSRLAVAS